jgi:hypothetical protein
MGGKRSTAFITNSTPIMPTTQEEPIYSEISVVQMQRGNRLEPLQRADANFLSVVPASFPDPTPKMVGQRAARFNLTRLEKLLDRCPEKALRIPWNPILLTKRLVLLWFTH